jgi:hypothetical protein
MKKFYIKKRSNFKMNKLIYNLLEQEINEKILVDSINLCKSSIFLRFKSMKNKLKIIKESYDGLRKILED